MRVGDVKHDVLHDGNIRTQYKSEGGMCCLVSFEAKSAAWMEKKRLEVKAEIERKQ